MSRMLRQLQNAGREYQNLVGDGNPLSTVGMPSGLNGGPGNLVTAMGMPAAVASFTINIRRITAAIASPLPVLVGMSAVLGNSYGTLLANTPGGNLLTNVTGGPFGPFADRARIVFTFTNGADVDTVEITCAEVDYTYLLALIQTNPMRTNMIKALISNAAIQAQFNQRIQPISVGFAGLVQQQSFTPSQFGMDTRQQSGQIDMPVEVGLDSQTGLVVSMEPQANFTLSLVTQVQVFSQIRSLNL